MGDQPENKQNVDVQAIVQQAIQEYVRHDVIKREPAYKAELQEERRRREQLEKRLNEVVEENKQNRQLAEKADRNATIRAELQKLGVSKVDLAFKAVQDDIYRADDGKLVVRNDQGEVNAKEYLATFVSDNPEFLPARISGGSGITTNQKASTAAGPIDLDKISPAMSKEDLDRVRQEIIRVASQNVRSL